MYADCSNEMLYPDNARNAKTAQHDRRIVGKKATPPKRGIARLCTLRSSGISNNRLWNEIIKMRGIISLAIQAEIQKDMNINRMLIVYSFLKLLQNPFPQKVQPIALIIAKKTNNKTYIFIPRLEDFKGTTAGSTMANTGFSSCTFALATCN